MNAEEIMNSEDFKRCVKFHGHICPGLSIGYRAAKAGMRWLEEKRAEDEEMVAIVETDACSADAVQVLTGCTFGKGNFIYRDFGKMALTLFSRGTGKGVRISMRPEANQSDPEHMTLLQKIMGKTATDIDRKRFKTLHHRRAADILGASEDALFVISPVDTKLPPKAKVEPSELCARCGESTMPSKMENVGSEKICRGCAGGKQA
jgi:formylmethanofuran dehydrogenase subunit E